MMSGVPPDLTRGAPYVGRETQLGAVTAAVTAAEFGESVLVLIAGEPGIGKSRLVAEVASRSSTWPVWAACWEGDGAPPYWPWRQLVRLIAAEHPREMAEAVDDLEGLGPSVAGGDPWFELFDAVAGGFAAVSRLRPLLLLLEDLHWADEGTVRLLRFVVRDTRPRRLAIVGTYRDTDLDPRHPLALSLADLVRDGLHVVLGGLGPRDVGALAAALDPGFDARRAVALHRRTGGNPFFLWELLRLHQLEPAGDPERLSASPGVRAVVARRLATLSPPTHDVLAAAAVLGAEATPAILAALLEQAPPTGLRAALAEGAAAGLVAATAGGDYAFLHDLVREVLYDGLDPTVRADLHRRAARALTDRHGDARPVEVAHHLFAATPHQPDETCVVYAVRAAESTAEVHAYADAAHWYRRALHALPSGEGREIDLLLRSGAASLTAGDLPHARAAFERAARSIALSLVADEARRRSLGAEAVAVARAVGDARALGYALAAACDADAGPDGCDRRNAAAVDVVRLGAETRDRQLELLGLRLRIVALLEIGDIGAADPAMERYALITERLRQPLYRWYVPLWRGMRALMRGDLDEAARQCAEAEQLGDQAASGNAVALTFTQWWVRRRYAGQLVEAGSAMAHLLADEGAAARVTAGPRAVIAALTGDLDRARALLGEWLGSGLPDRARDSEWLPESAQLAQVAVAVGDTEVAERLYADLRPYAQRFCVEGIGAAVTGSVAWYLALLADFLGRPAEAVRYAERARAAHLRVGLIGDPPPMVASAGAPAPTVATGPSLAWEGPTWTVTWGGSSGRVRDSKGLGDLARLLSRPQHDVHCLELVGGSDVGGDSGPALDQRARRAYEQRIRDLQIDIDEAREHGDLGRAERAEEELDALVQQLSQAYGLTGRSRSTGSAAERARSAVGWRIRAAIRHLGAVHPELGRHLQNTVRTGQWCSYRPETAVTWSIRSGRSA
jgi:tetratricopeptide (TPR) repeat protein